MERGKLRHGGEKTETQAKAARKLRQSETDGAHREESRGQMRGRPTGAQEMQGDGETARSRECGAVSAAVMPVGLHLQELS